MTNSQQVRRLLDKMESLETELASVKKEIGKLLGFADRDKPLSENSTADAKDKPARRKHRATRSSDGAVAKGTKGRKVLEAVYALGGQARAVPIAERIAGLGPRTTAVKKVRTYIYSLSHAETPYLEKAAEHGVWQLTQKAYEVLGKTPPSETEHAAPVSLTRFRGLKEKGEEVTM